VGVVDVNTQVTPQGEKKAIVTLSEDDDATEIASRIGVF
jgi:large subunit ribosomal protein L23